MAATSTAGQRQSLWTGRTPGPRLQAWWRLAPPEFAHDRSRSRILARAKARGLSVEDYLRGGNLLKREVKAEDVAQAFVDLALARKTTAAVLTVDGGNIAAALR